MKALILMDGIVWSIVAVDMFRTHSFTAAIFSSVVLVWHLLALWKLTETE